MDLLLVVQEFSRGVQQPRGFTSTLIVLIPKKKSKIISKVLTNRLNKILPFSNFPMVDKICNKERNFRQCVASSATGV